MKRLIVLCCVSLALLLPQAALACTTFIVTRGASADGSVMVSHSDDNDLNDQSIVYVPARDWPEGAQRPVYDSADHNRSSEVQHIEPAPVPSWRAFCPL